MTQNIHFNPVIDPMLRGWREVAVYLGVHPRTVKEWHYKYAPLPFVRDAAHRYSRWRIRASKVNVWHQSVYAKRNSTL